MDGWKTILSFSDDQISGVYDKLSGCNHLETHKTITSSPVSSGVKYQEENIHQASQRPSLSVQPSVHRRHRCRRAGPARSCDKRE